MTRREAVAFSAGAVLVVLVTLFGVGGAAVVLLLAMLAGTAALGVVSTWWPRRAGRGEWSGIDAHHAAGRALGDQERRGA